MNQVKSLEKNAQRQRTEAPLGDLGLATLLPIRSNSQHPHEVLFLDPGSDASKALLAAVPKGTRIPPVAITAGWWDEAGQWNVDVFYGSLDMAHELDRVGQEPLYFFQMGSDGGVPGQSLSQLAYSCDVLALNAYDGRGYASVFDAACLKGSIKDPYSDARFLLGRSVVVYHEELSEVGSGKKPLHMISPSAPVRVESVSRLGEIGLRSLDSNESYTLSKSKDWIAGIELVTPMRKVTLYANEESNLQAIRGNFERGAPVKATLRDDSIVTGFHFGGVGPEQLARLSLAKRYGDPATEVQNIPLKEISEIETVPYSGPTPAPRRGSLTITWGGPSFEAQTISLGRVYVDEAIREL